MPSVVTAVTPTVKPRPAVGSRSASAYAVAGVGVASCRLLTRARAATLTGLNFPAGRRDQRQNTAGRRQIDGCRYAATGGQVSYLVWTLSAKGTAVDVGTSLPGEELGATAFTPKVGSASAGATLTVGGMTNVVVNATKGTRLVQVTVMGASPTRSRSAAVAAAGALLAT